jgi:hypothetical protein
MKKLLLLLCLATVAHADTVTPTIGLIVPTLGSLSWGAKINQDLLIIDAAFTPGGGGSFGILGSTQTWTGGNTFTNGITAKSITLTGTGNLSFINSSDGLSYQVIGSRIVPVVGHFVAWASSNTIIDGGAAFSSFPNLTNDGTTIIMSSNTTHIITNLTSVTDVGVTTDMSNATNNLLIPTLTLAQMAALIAQAGQPAYCSNCVTDAMCVSTGTVNSFVRTSARATKCQ